MEAELGGKAGKRRVPPRLAVRTPPERHRLHVVEHPGPRDPAQLLRDREQPPQQWLECHPPRPPHGERAAVLQARRQKDPPHDLGPERDPRLAPVHLEKLPGQPSKRITGAAAAARTRFRPATKRYQLAALAVY